MKSAFIEFDFKKKLFFVLSVSLLSSPIKTYKEYDNAFRYAAL